MTAASTTTTRRLTALTCGLVALIALAGCQYHDAPPRPASASPFYEYGNDQPYQRYRDFDPYQRGERW